MRVSETEGESIWRHNMPHNILPFIPYSICLIINGERKNVRAYLCLFFPISLISRPTIPSFLIISVRGWAEYGRGQDPRAPIRWRHLLRQVQEK